jgi:hypothetical protein
MQSLVQWFTTFENAFALLVTLGVAFFLVCCLECATRPTRDNDDIFRHHAI